MIVPVPPSAGYPSEVRLEPAYAAPGVPMSGWVESDQGFTLTGSRLAGNPCPSVSFGVSGVLPPKVRPGGPFTRGVAQVAYRWSGVSPGNCAASAEQAPIQIAYSG
jgi:hypothetical protein